MTAPSVIFNQNGNGHRPGGTTSLETLPQLLDQLWDAADALCAVDDTNRRLIAQLDECLSLVDRRVEMARARERRRDRRNRNRRSS